MSVPQEKIKQCSLTLYDYLKIHARENGEKLYFITESQSWTYARAYSVVNGLAEWFEDFGIKKGTLVALRATRSPQTVMLITALGALGALVALTDPHKCVKSFISESGVDMSPEYYVTDESGVWRVSCGQSEKEIDSGCWQGERDNGSYCGDISAELPRAKADDPFIIIFTSGSTGKAKAVVLSHKNCIANPVDAMPLFKQNADDRAIALLPLNHVFGFAVAVCATFCGHDLMFPEKLDTDYVMSCIEKYNISVVYSVPSFFLGLLRDGAHKKYDLKSLRLGLMAGAPFTAEQLKYIEGELGLQLMPGYGMSECVGISTMNYGAGVEERSTGVGRIYPMTEIKIADGGEICVRGAMLMLGYYNDERATKEAIDREGWLHTGDLGYLDGNGFLHVKGRIKDIIIRNGNNLSSVAIEQKLINLPQIKDVCVVGVNDENEGEVPAALIVLNDGAVCGEDDIKKCLAKIEQPKYIKITDKIPLTSAGKYDKQKVKAEF
ncbi:MAG: class I adenylate-forming enzyme family protein [Candidatus Coproplasma sp.]